MQLDQGFIGLIEEAIKKYKRVEISVNWTYANNSEPEGHQLSDRVKKRGQ